MKKLLAWLTCLVTIFALGTTVKAEEETTDSKKITVYVFSKDGCPHCEEVKEFLSTLEKDKKYSEYFTLQDIQVYDANWQADETMYSLMNNVANVFGDEVSGVPYIVIGNEFSMIGYASSEADKIKTAIKEAYNSDKYEDVVAKLAANIEVEPKEKDSDDTITIIAILTVLVCGCGAMVFFSRKK